MSVLDLQQPCLTGGIRSVHFFNGRLLSGEDLSREQDANRERQRRLGNAVGTGIVNGLDVLDGTGSAGPTVIVKRGMAVNALGQTITLTEDSTLSLITTPPARNSNGHKTATFNSISVASTQQSHGLDEGVYLLAIAPTNVKEGFSPVAGSHNTIGFSGNSYFVDALQFRLFPLPLNSNLLSNPAQLRNKLAYACFGFSDDTPTSTLTPNPLSRRIRLLETLSALQPADVPLALLFWTNSATITFIDCWSVRRRITQPTYNGPWQDILGDQRTAESEAMFLQFQDQITNILQNTATASTSGAQNSMAPAQISAGQILSYLPPAGYLPIGENGFDWQRFLDTLAPQNITYGDQRLFRLILHNALFEEPIKVGPFGDDSAANEAPVDVFQDINQPGYVFFSRATTGQVHITIDAQGYQPASATISMAIGQQTVNTLPLQQKRALAQQRPLFVDVDKIERPVLSKIRLSLLQQSPLSISILPTCMIRVNPLPQNVGEWLSTWQIWLDGQYPNQGINSGPASIYIDDYYAPPKEGHIPDAPAAYALFGTIAIPLLLTLAYYINPLPVPLAQAGIRGLTTDVIQALAANGIITVDQVVGAWTTLIADITGESLEYSNCLISDAIETAEKINAARSYYEGLDEEVADILRQMALSDDVALANADQRELAAQLNSKGFAIRLIAQAREAIPAEHWSLDALKLKKEQIQSLQKIGISSKGELLARAETNKGHQELQRILGLSSQAIDDIHTNIYAQMITSSLTLARIKDLVLLPNVNAVIASQLADAEIDSIQEIASTDKTTLMEITRISEDAVEDLKHEARHARAQGLEVVHLASVTKEVADALNDVLGIKTIEHLSKASEEKVVEVFKRFHGDRAVNFVNALFDGIRGANK